MCKLETTQDLEKLPIEAVIRDVDGDEWVKIDLTQFRGLGAMFGFSFHINDMEEFLPVTLVENPGPVEVGGFRVGDEVIVTTDTIEVVRKGETGVVVGFTGNYIQVDLVGGLRFPFQPHELGIANTSTPDSEATGDIIYDFDKLAELPDTTVILPLGDPTEVQQKLSGKWWRVGTTIKFTEPTLRAMVEENGVRVIYRPSWQ